MSVKFASVCLIVFLVVSYGQYAYGFTVKQPDASFSDLTKEHALVMGNPAAAKKAVVFTDPDCPYCLKLHAELKKIVAERNDVAFYNKTFSFGNAQGRLLEIKKHPLQLFLADA